MPLQATSGAASYDAFGGGVPFEPTYIEQIFATHLYTGNGSTQTINNGIDLAGKGGLVWLKGRSLGFNNGLFDTVRGADFLLCSNNTDPSTSVSGIPAPAWITGFNSNGFGLGSNGSANSNTQTYVSWTFREQPKFFDVVTYTGNGALPNQLISHNLGSVPGCIIIKATNASGNWIVWHRGNGTTNYTGFSLNLTSASAASVASGDLPTATQFKPAAFFDPDYNGANSTGVTYVAYLFAHNAGGFGLTGTDNVISCGSFTTDGSGNATVNLGYEPQWVMVKKTSAGGEANSGFWWMQDNMRGYPVRSAASPHLQANTSSAEFPGTGGVLTFPTSTGFVFNQNYSGFQNSNFIYIAIRRGPMRTPTTGTSVFSPIASSAATGTAQTTNFPVDMQWLRSRAADATYVIDRLRGISTTPTTASSRTIYTNDTFAEGGTNTSNGWNNTGFSIPSQQGGTSTIFWNFRRAPGFFDEICFNSATAPTSALPHNLGVTPELVIYKSRTGSSNWIVFSSTSFSQYLMLNSNAASAGGITWSATSTTVNLSAVTGSQQDVAYLFASCPGVSKVGSYTGNGSSQTINCGFAGGARFVLIKRTDSTGDWYVYDTARGMTTLTDPYLLLNSTAAESATLGSVTTVTTGFALNAGILAAINTNAASYIFLAIA